MKVSDVMQRDVDFVSPSIPLSGVARIIFGRGINGIPVCKGKKIIGFITQRDILSKFYPSMQEYIEDPIHTTDFEQMENKVQQILEIPADKIMSKNLRTITADTPLLKAQSIMQIEKIGRLPVVDGKDNLIGILSKDDIFKALVGQKLPFEKEDEQFHDWLSRRYDLIIDQKERLSKEIPDLVGLFKKEKITNILDLGCGTGVHAIALAEEGFNVIGIDRSSRMIYVANQRKKPLSDKAKQSANFICTEYDSLEKILNMKFDAVISMGAGLAHIENTLQVLKEINAVLNKKAIIVCQIANYEKIIKVNKGLYDFHIRKSPFPEEREQAFLRFYDSEEEGFLKQNVSVFARGSRKWIFKGMKSMQIRPLDKGYMKSILAKIGFSNINYFGGEKGFFYDYLFSKPFKPMQSDVLTVVARR